MQLALGLGPLLEKELGAPRNPPARLPFQATNEHLPSLDPLLLRPLLVGPLRAVLKILEGLIDPEHCCAWTGHPVRLWPMFATVTLCRRVNGVGPVRTSFASKMVLTSRKVSGQTHPQMLLKGCGYSCEERPPRVSR